MTSTFVLRPNVPGRTANANLAVQHVYAPGDGTVTVHLVVAAAIEQTITLEIGISLLGSPCELHKGER
ncbi:hypothetical protein [Streptomyces filipinensis]|nr:hypothetical protein [Streptomyces filipinensis]